MKIKLKKFLFVFKLQLGCILFVAINLLMTSYIFLFYFYLSTEESYDMTEAVLITIYVSCILGTVGGHMLLFGTGAKKIRMLMTGLVIVNLEKIVQTLCGWICLYNDFMLVLILWTIAELVIFIYCDIVVISFWKQTVYVSEDDDDFF